jgi:hypothetical protein
LREFKNRLAAVDYDLLRLRDELYCGGGTSRGRPTFSDDIDALFDTNNVDAASICQILQGMLRKDPLQRTSVRIALSRFCSTSISM